ncbi:hypothetical protein CHCC20494_4372 [Bacillus licheniformis]|nr:hypothetical protein CHCC20493_2357 [Bacillus licheniformis]TWM71199.1 hypothetical protein CHCC14810_0565 [Bacillus licheniformis]TWN09289.1 hypothetical protein CHCC14561_3621 [Bacillus licheniformis]TWN79501.1 hypothetical protein CHCC20494_4372 [Bacillus licheniformis]
MRAFTRYARGEAPVMAMNEKVCRKAKEGAVYAPSVIHEYEVV